MSQRESGQNFDPKHRIIGAVVVVALAVVLVPLVLGKRETPSEPSAAPSELSADAAADTKVAVTIVTPSIKSKPAKPETTPASAPVLVDAGVLAKEPTKTPSAKPVAVIKTAPTPAKTPAVPAVTGGWVVQVGTFSNTDNAARVEQKLRQLGQTVRAEHVEIDSGKAVRVRVGPFVDRSAALKAQERIQKETGIKVVVLAYP